MTDLPKLSKKELEQARTLGAATYINAYLRLMALALGVEIDSQEQVAAAGKLFVEPMNEAMTFCWAIFVHDRAMAEECLNNMRVIMEADLEDPGVPE